jgi:SAM-dependent methyltransferase
MNNPPFNNPLSSKRADDLVRLLELSPLDGVLDAGCGRGEFLIRVVEASGCRGLGIDRDAACIAAARLAAAGRAPAERCEFRAADTREVSLEPASFAAGICLGATHAFASGAAAYPAALERLGQLVRPGGKLLIGEGYWKQQPAPEYLELLGDPVGIYHDHAGNIEQARGHGLQPVHDSVSSTGEWDAFESAHLAQIERRAALTPDDVALSAKVARARRWYDGYQRWGRDTLGFGFYLLRIPG